MFWWNMKGLWYAVGAYAIWGCFPLFFSLLGAVPPESILAYRIVFACLFALLLLVFNGQLAELWVLLQQRKILLWSLLSSLLITVNWYVFIWAVAHLRVVETSLGYFITPLVSLLIGRIILKESINRMQALAGIIAAFAILFEFIALGGVPWVSLVLALSFGLYGLVRKLQPMDSLLGLTLETLWVTPVALFWVFYQGSEWLTSWSWTLALLFTSGIVTAIPLLMFAASVRSLNLVVAGFIMYLNPMMQFVSAIWILGEAVPTQRYITFFMVWLAMIFFIIGLVQKAKSTSAKVTSLGSK